MVEFALVLPLLLVLVIGIFDFAQALNAKNQLSFLANTAARYAEVNKCAPCGGKKIDEYVAGTAVGLPNTPTITFSLPNANKCNVGDPLKVTATVHFPWFLGVNLPGLPKGGTAIDIVAPVTVRILQSPTDGSVYTFTPSVVYPCNT